MKKTLLLIAVCLAGLCAYAQTPEVKGLNVITKSAAEAHVRFLASDELEGREAGSRGSRVAARYIVSRLQETGIGPLDSAYEQPFRAYRKERQRKGRFQVHPDSVARLLGEVHQCLPLTNILGKIEGKRSGEYVIVGAHYDHLGTDPWLAGDRIYPGADDNASGVSAVLQIAAAFRAAGVQPERTVIFAFWDGEEKGLLGSAYFVQRCRFADRIRGYLNFDMIGRNHDESRPRHVVYFYTAAHPVFGRWLKESVAAHGLALEPDYRPWDAPVSGSDNASFAREGIPVIWYHTDGHPDYHLPSDRADKINWEKLTDITKASFLTMWHLANDPEF